MNAPAPHSPRLVCRSVRWWNTQRSDASRLAARHAAHCPDCARYFAALPALEADLRHEASAVTRREIPAPPGLEERIWAAVAPEVSRRTRAPRASLLRRWLPLELTAVAALVVTGFVWTVLPDSADAPDRTPNRSTAALAANEFQEQDLQALADSVRDLSQRFLQPPPAPAAPANAPAGTLESEWVAVNQDARAALRFLERSFLPSASSSS